MNFQITHGLKFWSLYTICVTVVIPLTERYLLFILCFFIKYVSHVLILYLQLGMYTLSIMTEMSKSTYLEHAESFAVLFTGILSLPNELNSNLAYYTILTMNNLVPVIGGHQQVCGIFFIHRSFQSIQGIPR